MSEPSEDLTITAQAKERLRTMQGLHVEDFIHITPQMVTARLNKKMTLASVGEFILNLLATSDAGIAMPMLIEAAKTLPGTIGGYLASNKVSDADLLKLHNHASERVGVATYQYFEFLVACDLSGLPLGLIGKALGFRELGDDQSDVPSILKRLVSVLEKRSLELIALDEANRADRAKAEAAQKLLAAQTALKKLADDATKHLPSNVEEKDPELKHHALQPPRINPSQYTVPPATQTWSKLAKGGISPKNSISFYWVNLPGPVRTKFVDLHSVFVSAIKTLFYVTTSSEVVTLTEKAKQLPEDFWVGSYGVSTLQSFLNDLHARAVSVAKARGVSAGNNKLYEKNAHPFSVSLAKRFIDNILGSPRVKCLNKRFDKVFATFENPCFMWGLSVTGVAYVTEAGRLIPFVADAQSKLVKTGIVPEEVPAWENTNDDMLRGSETATALFRKYLEIAGACLWGAIVTNGWTPGDEIAELTTEIGGGKAGAVPVVEVKRVYLSDDCAS